MPRLVNAITEPEPAQPPMALGAAAKARDGKEQRKVKIHSQESAHEQRASSKQTIFSCSCTLPSCPTEKQKLLLSLAVPTS